MFDLFAGPENGRRHWRQRATALLAAVTLAVATSAAASAQPGDQPGDQTSADLPVTTQWAPVQHATLTPGVQMYTDDGQCTANFVYTDASGATYLGYAAHCAGLGEATDTDGCAAGSLPLGTRVRFAQGGSLLSAGTTLGGGTLAYSSWLTMAERGESDANACAYNDLALVRVDAADVAKVNPSVPVFGGPVAVATSGTRAGDRVYSYGNSSLRGGVSLLSPKVGISLGDQAAAGGWTHPLYTLTPGVPGDSGSGFLNARGEAQGTLSTLGLLPLPLSNNIGNLARELAYAQQYGGLEGLVLVPGTEPFKGL